MKKQKKVSGKRRLPRKKDRHNHHGTTVAGTFRKRGEGRHILSPERIEELMERTYVGTLQIKRGYNFLITEDKALSCDIFIPLDSLKNGKNGDKAVVKITEWPKYARNPIGEVIDVLGAAGENTTEMHAILAEFGLPYKYPEAIAEAAKRITATITDEDIGEREDFRNITTFTIDPEDAKDFDDALSFRALSENKWEIGVHIADVTHYVKQNDIIDCEAQERATSVYLVDRTISMLPERLSNELCSLRQGEDKLCFSVIFEMNESAEILSARIVRTVICSNRRFTYEEAQRIIETGEGDYKAEVLRLNQLAATLREKRFNAGAIDFDRYEVKFRIDEKGKPLSIYFKESKEANHLVEEFMLLANRHVAETIGKTSKAHSTRTFVYRIHDQPDPEKLRNFAEFVSRLGYKLQTTGNKNETTKSINRLLDKTKGKPEQTLVETLAVRSMQKAVYSTDNIGHYGLAYPFYTHFTSPIRRYPDMMVHRLLERYASGKKSVDRDECEEQCRHCSAMEQLAANAERASIKYKQVEFMLDKVGQVYDGIISGVTEWGFYVELNENKCEGLVSVRDLDDDYYDFDEKNYCLRGRRYKHIYRLSDPVTVQIAGANMQRKQLDFMLV